MVSGLLEGVATFLTVTFAVEASRLLIIKKDEGGHKFRPLKWISDSNLEPYQKTIVVSAVSLGIAAAVTLLYNYVFKSQVLEIIESFSPMTAILYNLSLGTAGVVHYTYNIKEKKADGMLWKLIAAIVVFVLLFAQLQYGVFNSISA